MDYTDDHAFLAIRDRVGDEIRKLLSDNFVGQALTPEAKETFINALIATTPKCHDFDVQVHEPDESGSVKVSFSVPASWVR